MLKNIILTLVKMIRKPLCGTLSRCQDDYNRGRGRATPNSEDSWGFIAKEQGAGYRDWKITKRRHEGWGDSS